LELNLVFKNSKFMKKSNLHIRFSSPLILFILAVVLLSCKKFVTIDPPKDQLTETAIFSSDEDATAAVRGMYSEIVSSFNNIGNGALTLYPALSADELSTTSTNATYDPFVTNSLLPTDSRVYGAFWVRGFFHIYQANAIIGNLTNSKILTPKVREQLLGEAKFMRAFFNFYLVNLFGPIPLATETDYTSNAVLSRTDTAGVYQQIVKDLTDAQGLLTPAYPTAEKVRVNYWSATALLSRVYLYLKDWTKAEAETSRIMNSGSYRLTTIDSVFIPNNSEAILEFLPPLSAGITTAEGFDFIPSSSTAIPLFRMTPYLLGAFETGDARKTKWTKANTVNGTSYSYPYKYKVRTATPGVAKTEYYIVLRLAEQYLIRAEARAQQDNFSGALSDLNQVRTRAGLGSFSTSDKVSILSAIEKERQVEFFTEWGHRWLDLKRTGRADGVLSQVKGPNWQKADQLYPVPQAEMNSNPSLSQNPGY
jgi:starch-binding outer membrane protein, SusD/RagB family